MYSKEEYFPTRGGMVPIVLEKEKLKNNEVEPGDKLPSTRQRGSGKLKEKKTSSWGKGAEPQRGRQIQIEKAGRGSKGVA